jgi:hypothetical protein
MLRQYEEIGLGLEYPPVKRTCLGNKLESQNFVLSQKDLIVNIIFQGLQYNNTKYLDDEFYKNCKMVSKSWKSSSEKSVIIYSNMSGPSGFYNIEYMARGKKRLDELLSRIGSQIEIYINDFDISEEEFFKTLNKLKNLRQISLSGFAGLWIKDIVRICPKLQNIELNSNMDSLEPIGTLKELNKLKIDAETLTNEQIKVLKKIMPQIETLDLSCRYLSDGGKSLLLSDRHLNARALNLSAPDINLNDVIHVFPNLTKLSLYRKVNCDCNLKNLHSSLSKLHLVDNELDLPYIKNCFPNLTYMRLTTIGDSALLNLALCCTTPIKIDVSGTRVSLECRTHIQETYPHISVVRQYDFSSWYS